jgi:hypothetical protein
LTTAGRTFFTTGAKERRTSPGLCGDDLWTVSAKAGESKKARVTASAKRIKTGLRQEQRPAHIGGAKRCAKKRDGPQNVTAAWPSGEVNLADESDM